MKFQIMIGILFTLLSKRKVSAAYLASKYGVSVRSVYRYVDEMTCAGVPIDVARGAGGGIYISDAFKLPKGLLTREEYASAVEAMLAMNEQLSDANLRSAIEKLTAQAKSETRDLTLSGNILVDSGTWGDANQFSEKLSLLERAIEHCTALEIDYVSREGEKSRRKIYPHLLVYKQKIWYVYAYCTKREAFRLFKVGRIRSLVETEEQFVRIPFRREDVPLKFWPEENSVMAMFEISTEALPYAEEWLGIENIVLRGEKHIAEVALPDDESLVGTILSIGGGPQVPAPASPAERVKKEAAKISAAYRE